MDESKFIEKYKKLSPSIQQLKNINVSDEFIKKEVDHFDILLIKKNGFSDHLWNLVNSYSIEKVNISDIRLGLKIEETTRYYFVGLFEENDRIVVEKLSGLIKILDGNSNQELFLCAINSSKFLDVLFSMAEYFINCMVNEELYNDIDYKKRIFRECIDLAGGEKFLDFYQYIFVL